MGKSQMAALVFAGVVAGAGGSQFISSATKEGTTIDVQFVRSRPMPLADGGVAVQVETCGIVNKHDGLTPSRWCDYRQDPHMDALVAASVDRVQEAAVKGEKRQAESKAQLEVMRQRQAADAEKRRQALRAARDAGVPQVITP